MTEELSEKNYSGQRVAPFYLMIAGLSLATLGAAITGFSISLWILDHTESIALFTLVAAVNTLPTLILSPLAGAFVDRWKRKKVLVIAELGTGISTLCLAIIYWNDLLEIHYIILFGSIAATFQAFVLPALSASTVMMVPAKQLNRANSFRVVSMGLAQLIAPGIAGFLLASIALDGIFVLNLLGIAIGISAVIAIKIPQPIKSQVLTVKNSSVFSEMSFAWRYLKQRTGLYLLLFFYAILNFSVVSLHVLFMPLVKNFASVKQIGMVASVGGAGILFGGLVTAALGDVQHKVMASLLLSAVVGLTITFSTIMPSVYSVGVGVFLITMIFPIIMSLSQTVWQRKLEADIQGRIFGFRTTIVGATMPIAYIVSGILADGFFEPGMQTGGMLAEWFGGLYGTGKGRGLALMAGVYGLVTLVVVVLAVLHPRVRNLEKELPDCEVVAEGQT